MKSQHQNQLYRFDFVIRLPIWLNTKKPCFINVELNTGIALYSHVFVLLRIILTLLLQNTCTQYSLVNAGPTPQICHFNILKTTDISKDILIAMKILRCKIHLLFFSYMISLASSQALNLSVQLTFG